MAELGRAALVVTLGLTVYALVAGAAAAHLGRRRLAASAQNALVAAFGSTLVCVGRSPLGAPPERLLVHVRRADDERGASHRVHDLRLLGRPGGVAPALAPRAHRLRGGGGPAQPGLGARSRRLGRPRVRGGGAVLRVPRGRGREPVRDPARARRRRRDDAQPAEPVHAGPPAAALPRLRRAHRAVRVRAGGAHLGAHRRTLARRDAPLDARRLDRARDRTAARRALGLRGGRLGRLLRLGSGRERCADAVARGDGLPALGHGPGEARDAPRLERPARHRSVRALAVRDVPHAVRASSTRSTRSRRARSGPGSWRSSGSCWRYRSRSSSGAFLGSARRPSSSPPSRARQPSSTTTCSSSRSASRSSGASCTRCSPRRSAARRWCSGARTTTSSCALSASRCCCSWGSARSSRGVVPLSRAS